jgi:hypothetical protein
METWTLKMKIFRIASLLAITASLWYLLLAPSLKLKESVRIAFNERWAKWSQEDRKSAQEVAKFDLEQKVYPEIQDRLTKINDWFINKMLFAGGLLGAFLLQLWWPFWSQNTAPQERSEQTAAIFLALLKSAPVCAVLGLACVVSLFMDIHIRRSLLLVHQLGVWAAEYGTVAFPDNLTQFSAWERFIRMPAASLGTQVATPGMHESLIDAVQTGNLSLMTLVLFAFYQWTFQAVCRHGLDEFNRLTYCLLIAILLVFLLVTHQTSGNFEFAGYGHGLLFCNFWGYFVAWGGITVIMVAWDCGGSCAARHGRCASRSSSP